MDKNTRVHLVTKSDGMRQVVPITATSRKFLTKQNDSAPDGKKMIWEDMSFEEAEAIIKTKGVVDVDHSPEPLVGALKKALTDKDDLLAAKDAEIEEMRRLLSEKYELAKSPVFEDKKPEGSAPGFVKAADLIAKIWEAKTKGEIDFIIDGEDRVTVLDAAKAAKEKLTN